MPYLSKYHLAEQHAPALLGPMAAAMAELEHRAQHHAERLALSATDREAMLAAHRILADARAEIERLRVGLAARPEAGAR